MGVSPWKTSYQLWLEKMSDTTDFIISPAMQRGIDLEPEARRIFCQMTGLIISPTCIFHPEYNYMMASLDGADDEISPRNIVEIKCPGERDHLIAKSGEIPEKYFPQLQHQIETCRLDMSYYFSFYNEKDVAIVKVYRNDPYIKRLLKKEEEFYDCMQNFTPPAMTDKDYKRANFLEEDIAQELMNVKKRKKELENDEERLHKDLIIMCGNQNTIGKNFKLTKNIRKGSVEYSNIPELSEVNLDKYRKKPTEYWRVS